MALHDLGIMSVSGAPGTGAITLNAATDGGVTFAAAGVVDGELVTYALQDGTNREVGTGTYTAAGTLLSRTLIASTTGSLLNLTSASVVFLTAGALDLSTGNLQYFGDGSDGDVTITGSTTLTRDMNYNNLTMGTGGFINTAGFRVHVLGKLLDTGNVSGAFRNNGVAGTSSVGSTGGAAAAAVAGVNIGGSIASGANGGAGGTGVGTQAGAATATSVAMGGVSGQGGKGGNGTPNAGGPARGATAPTQTLTMRRLSLDLTRAGVIAFGGVSGPGGSGGGGDGTNAARGGGGPGSGGGGIWIAARIIETNGSTPAGWIQANGGNGGNGGPTPVGNTGGGGGACSAGGGFVYLVFAIRIGTAVVGLIQVDGGTGGNGSAGLGTGIGGDGGSGGGCGRVILINLSTGLITQPVTPGSAASLATTASTTAGTAGTAGVQGRATL